VTREGVKRREHLVVVRGGQVEEKQRLIDAAAKRTT
jgi:hypothetical protein